MNRLRSVLFIAILLLVSLGSVNAQPHLAIDLLTEYLDHLQSYNVHRMKLLGAEDGLDILFNVSSYFFLVQTFLYAISLYGAYKMWHLQKLGFHIYAIAQILILITPEMFVDGLPFPFIQLLVTATFVFLYFQNLRLIK